MSNGFFYLVDSYVFFSGDLSVQVRLAHPSAHSPSDPSPGRGSGTPVFKAGGMAADAYRGQVSFLPRQLRGSKIFPVLVRSISVSSSVFSVHLHFSPVRHVVRCFLRSRGTRTASCSHAAEGVWF